MAGVGAGPGGADAVEVAEAGGGRRVVQQGKGTGKEPHVFAAGDGGGVGGAAPVGCAGAGVRRGWGGRGEGPGVAGGVEGLVEETDSSTDFRLKSDILFRRWHSGLLVFALLHRPT